MQSRLRLGGNPVQPLLLMFPLGFFTVAALLDLATQLGAPALVGTLAFWNVLAGLLGGVLAAVAGSVDAVGDPRRALILLLDMGVLVAFAVLALVRVRSGDRVVAPGVLLLEVLGCATAVASAWYGGRLDPNRPPRMRRTASEPTDDSAGVSPIRKGRYER
ncbi:DUF2231 domain-containing protein [Actinoplanes awajinensis]|uniref:DUF2231 domain-containing protein n=1 Tax=Actinoplanes awajinensis subsp. mycoplanecinus TaxID=135947 RepID=A0A101JJV1_9ACTN|nr:DUF2231 domain-containing protein [Actinoplanes awajinensis]KUL28138.1 hypothetical protein ADL15_32590 [Actinoplanes awajinensis subsp. mycoplanecinus]